MKLDRFRAPALAATAVLLISGGASAFAASPAPVGPAPATPVVQVEPTGLETDTLQVGDQTTPDVASAATTSAAESVTPETASETPEAPDTQSDGSGGHADPAGQNVDHQFDGQE